MIIFKQFSFILAYILLHFAIGQFSPVDVNLNGDGNNQIIDPFNDDDLPEFELPDESEPLFTNSEIEVPIRSWQVESPDCTIFQTTGYAVLNCPTSQTVKSTTKPLLNETDAEDYIGSFKRSYELKSYPYMQGSSNALLVAN